MSRFCFDKTECQNKVKTETYVYAVSYILSPFFYHHIKKTEETVFHMEYFIIFVADKPHSGKQRASSLSTRLHYLCRQGTRALLFSDSRIPALWLKTDPIIISLHIQIIHLTKLYNMSHKEKHTGMTGKNYCLDTSDRQFRKEGSGMVW